MQLANRLSNSICDILSIYSIYVCISTIYTIYVFGQPLAENWNWLYNLKFFDLLCSSVPDYSFRIDPWVDKQYVLFVFFVFFLTTYIPTNIYVYVTMLYNRYIYVLLNICVHIYNRLIYIYLCIFNVTFLILMQTCI